MYSFDNHCILKSLSNRNRKIYLLNIFPMEVEVEYVELRLCLYIQTSAITENLIAELV